MIAPPAGARILLATRPVDFRKGAHSLAALAAEALGANPFSGVVLVFRSRRADRIKILLWDGSGLALVWKQLEGGAFRWPPVVDGVLRLTPVEFAALFDGIDWRRVHALAPGGLEEKEAPANRSPRRIKPSNRCCRRQVEAASTSRPTGPTAPSARGRR